jgi:hypothetical protein
MSNKVVKRLVGAIEHSCRNCVFDDDDIACIATDCTDDECECIYVFSDTDNLTPEDINQ